MLRLTTVLFVLSVLFVPLPSHAALVAGPERPISSPKLGLSTVENVLDVATDGTDFLTLWSEDAAPRRGLYATIVSEQGVPRPVAPEPIADEFTLAHAVWTGDAYLVIYHQTVLGPPVTVRLNRDAQVISERTVLDTGGSFVWDLAWNGNRALAIVAGEKLTGALLDGNGRVLRSGIALPAQTAPDRVTVAAAGDAFVVAWSAQVEAPQLGLPPLMTVRAARISADGEVSAPVELMAPARGVIEMASASTADDAGIALTRHDYREAFKHLLRFTVDGPTFSIDARPEFSVLPDTEGLGVIAIPGGFSATYSFFSSTAPFGLRLGSVRFDANARMSVAVGPTYFARSMRVATNGRTVLAVFQDYTAAGVTFDADATHRKSEVAPVSLAWAQQSNPVIASSGDRLLATWTEAEYPNNSVLLAQRRDADGNALDGQPFVVARGGIWGEPAITFTGKVWLIAWRTSDFDGSQVLAKRVSPQGVVLDAEPIDLGAGASPALASNGTVTALVTSTIVVSVVANGTLPPSRPIQLVRFTPDGEKIDSTSISAPGPLNESPSIATNGTEFLVTWSLERKQILGRRLAADGTPMDAAPITIASGGFGKRDHSRVASHGTDFVVAYMQWEPTGPLPDPPPVEPLPEPVVRVFTKRVLRNGALADSTPDQDGSLLGEGTSPRIVSFGDGYAVTFLAPQQQPYDRVTLLALPLDSRGAVLAPPNAVIRDMHSYSIAHSLAAIGNTLHAAYARVAPELGNVQRVYLRTLIEQASKRRPARR